MRSPPMNSLNYRLHQLEQELAKHKIQARRESFQNFVETLTEEGKISRADQPSIVDFLCSLPDGSVESAYFQKFLSDRPKVAEFTESPELKDAIANARRQYESSWRNQ